MGGIEKAWASGSVALADVQVRCGRDLRRLAGRIAAQSTVEYALVGALVVIAAAGALTLLGGELASVFSRISTTLSGAAPPAR
jgi:Flp pilus assembly pilin Flp